jgi:glycosyltransferase involved in cell wall biosynthesis
MESVKVAIVAASNRSIGGQGVQAESLLAHWLNDADVNVRFIPIDPRLPAWMRWVERIPALRTLVRTPFYLAELSRGTADADIVHIFSAAYTSFLLAPVPAWFVARIRRKRTLIHYHSGAAHDHLSHSAVAKSILMRADKIIAPSMFLVNVFREFDLEADAIPNVVDVTQFQYRPRDPLQLKLVCTRGFHSYYCVDVVVRAFHLVKQKYPSARLCLVGDGAGQQQIRDLAANLGITDIEFAGPVAHSQIPEYYEKNDIFINASWRDNMPVSILEAFASGTPVVTTAAGGIPYLVEHERTGLLSDPWDWKVLADNVVRLVREPELATRLAQNGHEEALRCSWSVLRDRWLQTYKSMLAAPSRSQQTCRTDSTALHHDTDRPCAISEV